MPFLYFVRFKFRKIRNTLRSYVLQLRKIRRFMLRIFYLHYAMSFEEILKHFTYQWRVIFKKWEDTITRGTYAQRYRRKHCHSTNLPLFLFFLKKKENSCILLKNTWLFLKLETVSRIAQTKANMPKHCISSVKLKKKKFKVKISLYHVSNNIMWRQRSPS